MNRSFSEILRHFTRKLHCGWWWLQPTQHASISLSASSPRLPHDDQARIGLPWVKNVVVPETTSVAHPALARPAERLIDVRSVAADAVWRKRGKPSWMHSSSQESGNSPHTQTRRSGRQSQSANNRHPMVTPSVGYCIIIHYATLGALRVDVLSVRWQVWPVRLA